MTREDASDKIAKLTRLANDPRTPAAEAESARRQIAKLQLQHQLGPQELEMSRMGAAFDDLVEKVEQIVRRHPSMPSGIFGAQEAVRNVLTVIKKVSDADKAARLRQIVGAVRAATFLLGGHPIVIELKTSVDTALKNHELVI